MVDRLLATRSTRGRYLSRCWQQTPDCRPKDSDDISSSGELIVHQPSHHQPRMTRFRGAT
jgi:hypothetical protein